MTGKLLLLWLSAFPLMGSPGPATLTLASLGAAFGFRACRRYLLGIITGTTAVLLIVASGVSAIHALPPELLSALQIAAIAYILYLAWKIATAPVGATDGHQPQKSSVVIASFLPGLGLALANPKAFAAIGAVYSGHMILPGQPGPDTALKIAALTLVIVTVNAAWLAFGTTFSRLLTQPSLGRGLNILFALLLLTSVCFLLAG
ncbi:LysE family translocator [Pseudodonghicola xiamenensis]|uniref:Threonine transporter RhtB n=1 Tax=Pseudodonghicola xiamenensis TaxID=337702 RepID=A0A8J3H6T9_9RHOB|nr:LysE family translocator [Pseudodonghicola xiamenensis]GHG85772.1 threonine transporter RhtB [Pseudodonghicola xiamenensis]